MHLYLYIYVFLEFLLPTLNKFTIQYKKRDSFLLPLLPCESRLFMKENPGRKFNKSHFSDDGFQYLYATINYVNLFPQYTWLPLSLTWQITTPLVLICVILELYLTSRRKPKFFYTVTTQWPNQCYHQILRPAFMNQVSSRFWPKNCLFVYIFFNI